MATPEMLQNMLLKSQSTKNGQILQVCSQISVYFGLKYPYPHLIFIFLASTSEILGGPDIYKQFGDMINLTCVIKGTAAPPETIYWYHRGKVRYRNHLYSNTYIPLMYQFYLGNKLLFQSRWSRRCQYNK